MNKTEQTKTSPKIETEAAKAARIEIEQLRAQLATAQAARTEAEAKAAAAEQARIEAEAKASRRKAAPRELMAPAIKFFQSRPQIAALAAYLSGKEDGGEVMPCYYALSLMSGSTSVAPGGSRQVVYQVMAGVRYTGGLVGDKFPAEIQANFDDIRRRITPLVIAITQSGRPESDKDSLIPESVTVAYGKGEINERDAALATVRYLTSDNSAELLPLDTYTLKPATEEAGV